MECCPVRRGAGGTGSRSDPHYSYHSVTSNVSAVVAAYGDPGIALSRHMVRTRWWSKLLDRIVSPGLMSVLPGRTWCGLERGGEFERSVGEVASRLGRKRCSRSYAAVQYATCMLSARRASFR